MAVVASGGQVRCGSFVPGYFAFAYRGEAAQDSCLRFSSDLPEGFPWYSGVLDFRFKLEEFSGPLSNADAPAMIRLSDGTNRYGVRVGLHEGGPMAGLVGEAGGLVCATGTAVLSNYEDVLPGNGLADWHHVTFFWCQSGLPVSGNPKVALYLDGALHSTAWGPQTSNLMPLPGAWLEVAVNEAAAGRCLVDHLRVFPLLYPYWMEEIAQALATYAGPEYFVCVLAQDVPHGFRLAQNQPNPFNPSTAIHFTLTEGEYVTLRLYDVTGRQVRTLLQEQRERGEHEILVNAGDLPSGVYYYRLEAGAQQQTRAMLLVK